MLEFEDALENTGSPLSLFSHHLRQCSVGLLLHLDLCSGTFTRGERENINSALATGVGHVRSTGLSTLKQMLRERHGAMNFVQLCVQQPP